MLFNSWLFAAFLAIVLPLYYRLPHRGQNLLLLIASYAFYSAWDYRFCSLLIISSVVDFVVARRIRDANSDHARRSYLLFSLVTNFGILGFFKYFNFFADSTRAALAAIG